MSGRPPKQDGPTVLYRHFGKDDQLLYVVMTGMILLIVAGLGLPLYPTWLVAVLWAAVPIWGAAALIVLLKEIRR